MTGIIQLYSKLVNLSFKDHIKLLFMVVKTAGKLYFFIIKKLKKLN